MHDTLQATGLAIWFTGLSGAGKTTLCRALETDLHTFGYRVRVLDAEELRRTMNRDLGFSKPDRDENVARLASAARDYVAMGYVVLVAAISPYRRARARARVQIAQIGGFLEVHVDAPLQLCIRRDPKGLYTEALSGELPQFTGIDDPYEPPLTPDVYLNTAREDIGQCIARLRSAVHNTLRADQPPLLHATSG